MKRNELAVKGSAIGMISQIVSLLMKFAVRTAVIRYLGREILGLDGVLIDTISMLSLAEMGITSAMLYRLYSPIIHGETDRVNTLMATYRKIYHGIAVIVAFVGILISFALKLIITGISIPWINIYIAFYLQLACSVSSYLLAYKRILLNADQKKHLCSIADLATNIVFSILKIISIVIFKSYTVYLVLNIAQIVTANILLLSYCRKHYPYINNSTQASDTDLRIIVRDTKDLLGNKLAGYVYRSTDNLIISIFMGTGVVGVLSNYKYLATALRSLVYSATSIIQPIVGNYLNSDVQQEDSFKILQRYTFVRYVIAGATALPLVTISHFFVRIWSGDDAYLLSTVVPVLLAAEYYIGCVYGPLGEYILGMGLFKKGKYAMYAGAFCNVALSLIGAKLFGIWGVLGATVVSQLVIWIGDGIIIFGGYFRAYPAYRKTYTVKQVLYLAIVLASGFISYAWIETLTFSSVVMKLILGGIATEVVFFAFMVLLLHRTDEYGYAKDMLMATLNKVLRRNKPQEPRGPGKRRIEWIDVVRGLAIILMVVGHNIQIGSGDAYLSNQLFYENWVFRFIYSFHMPCLMLLSGYFFQKTVTKPDFWKNRWKTILVPILAWSILPVALSLGKAVFTHQLSVDSVFSSLRLFLTYYWFLWAILIDSILVWAIRRYCKDSVIVYCLAGLIMMALPDWLNTELWKFMYPFFVVGYLWKKPRFLDAKKPIITVLLTILFAVLLLFYNTDSFVYTTGICVRSLNQLAIDLYRYLIGFAGSAWVIWLVYLCYPFFQKKLKWANRFLAYLGRISITVYLVSAYLNSYLLGRLTAGFSLNYGVVFIETLAILGFAIVVDTIIRKSKLLRRILLGSR